MKKIYWFIILALSFCLFVYLFYRTERTVVTEMFISLISFDRFIGLRKNITNALPLNKHIVYSLPEGLWVFCITLTSKYYFLKFGGRKLNLINRITHLSLIGNIAIWFVYHKSFYQLMPNAV